MAKHTTGIHLLDAPMIFVTQRNIEAPPVRTPAKHEAIASEKCKIALLVHTGR